MFSANERRKIIEERLTLALQPLTLEVIDESEFHLGHPGAQTGASHFYVKIVSEKFNGLTLIQRHQLVYQQLADLIPKEVHALKIKTEATQN